MIIEKGNRRVVVITEFLITLIILAGLAVINPKASTVVGAAIAMLAGLATLYFGGDTIVKAKGKVAANGSP